MKLYNTLTRSLNDFVPVTPHKVGLYHCGPTVYWTQHIGNLRGMTMGDLLVRTLRYFDYEVTHVRNYTDVGHLTSDSDTGEDKMEKGAIREGLTPDQIALKYIAQFEKDTQALNLVEPTYKPRASQYISEMINMISELLAKGFAYETDLAVYFEISKFPKYTELSHQKLTEMISGTGKGDVTDPNKKNSADFALWFFKAGIHAKALQTWPSPFHSKLIECGIGFPGWHIECSAMSRALIGKTVDIHFGGVEHIPVHHTNEIAQSEAANGVQFVKYWLHNEHLVVDNAKMAKSAGTGMSLDEITGKGYEPLALRYFFLQAQYRTRQNFTWEALDGAANALKELRNQLRAIIRQSQNTSRTELSNEKLEKLDRIRTNFDTAISQDLNIPLALSILWELVKSNIPSGDKLDLIYDFDRVLGLNLKQILTESIHDIIPPEITQLATQRDKYRKVKNFSQADLTRKQIEDQGYIVEDSPLGTVVKKK